jgi:hypothetical protein
LWLFNFIVVVFTTTIGVNIWTVVVVIISCFPWAVIISRVIHGTIIVIGIIVRAVVIWAVVIVRAVWVATWAIIRAVWVATWAIIVRAVWVRAWTIADVRVRWSVTIWVGAIVIVEVWITIVAWAVHWAVCIAAAIAIWVAAIVIVEVRIWVWAWAAVAAVAGIWAAVAVRAWGGSGRSTSRAEGNCFSLSCEGTTFSTNFFITN